MTSTEAQMEGYIVHGGVGLARGSLARIEDGKGLLVYLWDGALHITQERDRRDYFVEPGGCFELAREGVTLLYAMRRSHITITAPVEAHYARRISLRLPGALAPRVLYDRARESRGWAHGVRSRLARLWTNSYSRYAKPTTAAF
jgi:hypothetical protein